MYDIIVIIEPLGEDTQEIYLAPKDISLRDISGSMPVNYHILIDGRLSQKFSGYLVNAFHIVGDEFISDGQLVDMSLITRLVSIS